MKLEDDQVVFDSGKTIYCHGGVVGMDLEGDTMGVTYGYDGGFGEADKISREDWLELADHMIARWTEFRDRLRAGETP